MVIGDQYTTTVFDPSTIVDGASSVGVKAFAMANEERMYADLRFGYRQKLRINILC